MKRSFVRLLSTLFPNKMVDFAYQQLTQPQIRKLRERERSVMNAMDKVRMPFAGGEIQLYEHRGGKDSVLLIHGWEGQAGNFADLIEKLKQVNFTIYTFDAPSHGASSLRATSLFEFTDLVALLIRKYQVKKLVSHSFGGVATTYALSKNQDLTIDKYVLITTPDKFSERIQDVSKTVGITQKVQDRLIARFENETGEIVAEANVSTWVKKIKVNQAFLLHDKNDKVIPIARALNVAKKWSSCKFQEVEGTGHFRILRDEVVLDKVIDFLS